VNKFFKKLSNHFIPHEGNGHAPHFLRHESITFFFLLVIILELALLVQVFFVFNKTNFLAAVLPGVLTSLTNDQRVENNLSILTENDLLKQAAQLKANDMASRGYFSHNTPEGRTPWYFLDQVNYKYKLAGENLAVNFFESIDVANAWMASPTHRANIVKRDYTEIGIAIASGTYEGRNAVFVVQFFGKPTEVKKVVPIPTETNKINTNVASTTPVKVEDTLVLGQETTVKTNPVKKVTTSKPVITTTKNTTTATPVKVTQNDTNTPKETSPVVLKENNEIIPVTLAVSNKTISASKNFVNKILTSPNRNITNLLYIILGLILGIFITFLVKSEIMHPKIVIRSLALITIIVMLLFVNIKVFKTDSKIPQSASSFSAIAL